ncbi:hypothetical protein E0765_04665 [Sulfuricurvum sp. IAE1]|uniref:hypothetical protein n=1 Tax=Sulfuricurvum sp. IAE1 TaxID=2546102 RepID=UPI00104ED486|nr:hypothetical protein [Sulfuricurvum sp. IAE1]TDA65777.1 hypothetical protein E0765_04665 [Sulfuricurvum sp. IAE1]
MKKIFHLFLFAVCTLNADSLNSSLKNPSVSVTGVQRESAPIVVGVIPVALPGQACNSNTDFIAVTPDHSMELICKTNTWVQITRSNK